MNDIIDVLKESAETTKKTQTDLETERVVAIQSKDSTLDDTLSTLFSMQKEMSQKLLELTTLVTDMRVGKKDADHVEDNSEAVKKQKESEEMLKMATETMKKSNEVMTQSTALLTTIWKELDTQ